MKDWFEKTVTKPSRSFKTAKPSIGTVVEPVENCNIFRSNNWSKVLMNRQNQAIWTEELV